MRTVRCSGFLMMRGGVCLGGGVHLPLWTEFLTHICENITFPQLRLRTVIDEPFLRVQLLRAPGYTEQIFISEKNISKWHICYPFLWSPQQNSNTILPL